MSSSGKKSSRTRKSAARKQQDKRLEKEERDKLINYRYARLRNASRVAQEFGVSRMYVSRLWDRLPDAEREALLEVREQVDEDLNRKIAKAEEMAGDEFTANVVRARSLLGRELLRRCTGEDIRMLSDKDFTALLRLAATIASPDDGCKNPGTTPEESIFNTLRQSIHVSINNNE